MSSKTKIIVLHMKEVIYTCIFLLLLIILGVLVFFMFGPGKAANTSKKTDSRYTPGIYRTSIQLNNNSFDLEVAVDADRIRSIHLANLSESTSAMFPLVDSHWRILIMPVTRNTPRRCLSMRSKRLSRRQLLPEKYIEV